MKLFKPEVQQEPMELVKAKEDMRSMVEMYQAGFIDGYNQLVIQKRKWSKTMIEKCRKAFEFRFFTKAEEKVRKLL